MSQLCGGISLGSRSFLWFDRMAQKFLRLSDCAMRISGCDVTLPPWKTSQLGSMSMKWNIVFVSGFKYMWFHIHTYTDTYYSLSSTSLRTATNMAYMYPLHDVICIYTLDMLCRGPVKTAFLIVGCCFTVKRVGCPSLISDENLILMQDTPDIHQTSEVSPRRVHCFPFGSRDKVESICLTLPTQWKIYLNILYTSIYYIIYKTDLWVYQWIKTYFHMHNWNLWIHCISEIAF